MLNDSICDGMVELVVEEIDDNFLQEQAGVKVETLRRGRGQGAHGINDSPTNKANDQNPCPNTANKFSPWRLSTDCLEEYLIVRLHNW